VGFLSDRRRINVGVTRAKRHLAVVCDSDTCSCDAFLRSLLDHMTAYGDYLTAEEFMDLTASGVSPLTACSAHGGGDEGKELNSKGKVTLSNHQKQQGVSSLPSNTNMLTDEELTRFLSAVLSGEVAMDSNVQLSKEGLLSVNTSKKSKKKRDVMVHSAVRFPHSLSSYQRMQVHAVCEVIGLQHRSCGEGSERFVEVSREPFAPEVELTASAAMIVPPPNVTEDEVEISRDIGSTQKHPETDETSPSACEVLGS
jgi:ATP-dependent RNA/DNA helicase IGHMBP2